MITYNRGTEPRYAAMRRARNAQRNKWWLWFGATCLLLFIVANGATWAYYRNRTYPNTTIAGKKIGSLSFGQVADRATSLGVAPSSLKLTDGKHTLTVPANNMGLHVDVSRTKDSLDKVRSVVPIANFITKHALAAPVAITDADLQNKLTTFKTTFHATPVDAHVTLSGTTFGVTDGTNGYDLDASKLKEAVLEAIDAGSTTVDVPLTTVAPTHTTASLKTDAKKLQDQLSASVSFSYNGNTQKVSSAELASWYAPHDNTYALDDFNVRTGIFQAGVKMGVHPGNLTAAVSSTEEAITNNKPLTFALQPFSTTKSLHYCVDARGVSEATLDGLKTKLAATYADLRGWSLDGQVEFDYATSGCDFTVWMAAPSSMTSFGAICDSYWNCDVGQNVIINYNRWQDTSDAWKAYGGSLDDYHTMAINHETGHMLGFGHDVCPAKGQPAPVMMQESIDLQGCVFNIWPLPKEQAALRSKLGL